MKKYFTLPVLSLVLLVSCQKHIPPFQLPFVAEGELHIVRPAEISQKADRLESFLMYLGISGCQSCANALAELNNYASSRHVDVFYVNVDSLSINDAALLTSATDQPLLYYAFPFLDRDGSLTFPQLYIFQNGGVSIVYRSNFTANLDYNVQVIYE